MSYTTQQLMVGHVVPIPAGEEIAWDDKWGDKEFKKSGETSINIFYWDDGQVAETGYVAIKVGDDYYYEDGPLFVDVPSDIRERAERLKQEYPHLIPPDSEVRVFTMLNHW